MNEMNVMPHVRTLALCLQKMIRDGFVNDFSYTDEGLLLEQTKKLYKAEEVKLINTIRFEATSDPADNAVLYMIETNDGYKGTLVDAFGIYGKQQIII
jgi:Na+-translocating ferredoxin:NAD+ oxidoreductase RnfG subunit